MTTVIRVISETALPFGCVIREQEEESPSFLFEALTEDPSGMAAKIQQSIDTAPPTLVMTSGFNAHGHYIGSEKTTRHLVEERGISPEVAKPSDRVCSVGFCMAEQKWYGWSHRAIFGFGLGSTIKRGDCGYQAATAEAFGQQMLEFFLDDDKWHRDRTHRPSVDADGVRGVLLEAVYTDAVPNERLRGTKYENFRRYPETFGRGEWVVETMDDARQAACDFADAVG